MEEKNYRDLFIAGGEVFAWMYPTIHGNDLMVQMYGTEQYHTIRMVEDYSETGG